MQPNAPYPQNTQPQNDYSFITNPDKQPVSTTSFPGAGSPLARGLIVLGGLLIIVIVFVGIKGLLSGESAGPLFLGTAQDQQAMIHIVEKASQEPSISSANKNFAITAELSLASDRTKTVGYLSNNGEKVNEKQINLKLSLPLDTQLKDAAAASNYNTVFPQIMKTKLINYDRALQQTYNKTTGAKGRELLKSEHNGAGLLLKQLEAANP